MIRVFRPFIATIVIGIALCCAVATRRHAQQPAPGRGQGPAAPTGPLAPEQFKDIQVLKDMPADQLEVTMRYFSAATGFSCQQCHQTDRVTGVTDFAADSDHKKTARTMIQLVQTVNAGDFGGKINCGTCHAGRNQPAGLQLAMMMTPDQIAAAAAQAARQGGPGAGAPPAQGAPGQPGAQGGRGAQVPPPPVEDVVNKYIDALGGRTALEKLQSRVVTGTMTTRAAQTVPFTMEQKGDKYRETVQFPAGAVTRGFDGVGPLGWSVTADPSGDKAAPMHGFLLEQMLRPADLLLPLQLTKTKYPNLAAGRPAKLTVTPGATPIDVITVSGSAIKYTTERLTFDTKTGLLVRRVVSTATALRGQLVEQFDYSDYRSESGVMMPHTIKHTNWNTLDTLAITSIKVNVSLDDSRFAKPK